MALNDTVIKAAKPREKNWKLADEKGLYLLITPAGGKLWRVKFRVNVRFPPKVDAGGRSGGH